MLHGLLLTALLGAPIAHAEIVQRHVLSAIASNPDSEGADVMTMATASACGGRQLRMDAQSLRLDDAQYATLKRELQQRLRNKTPMLISVDKCPPGATGDGAVPIIRKISACTAAACKDGKARLYLHKRLFPIEQEQATYLLVLPLPQGAQPGTSKVDILSVAGQRLRLSGQINTADNASDFSTDKLVGGYTTYYPDGKIEKQVAQDGRGREHGVSSSYYPDGTLETQGNWRQGLPEGEHVTYHPSGKLREAIVYRDGQRIDGPGQTFDAQGRLSTRYTVRNGQLEGELLTYFPNGALASRAAMSEGKYHGPRTEYDASGAVRKTTIYHHDVAEGEANIFDRKGPAAD